MLKIIQNLTPAKSQQATREANFLQQVDFIYLSNARSSAIWRWASQKQPDLHSWMSVAQGKWKCGPCS